jgi:hypothetical protein
MCIKIALLKTKKKQLPADRCSVGWYNEFDKIGVCGGMRSSDGETN